jgi:hypothetical protein
MNLTSPRLAALVIATAVGAAAGAIVGYFVAHDGTSWGYWISHPISMTSLWWTLAGAISGAAVDFARRHQGG